jgi:hypothetical protein
MNDLESIVGALKGVTKDKKSSYPCTRCRHNADCTTYMHCYAWVTWFTDEWRKIRKYFGKV